MAIASGEETYNSEKIFREIQTEHMIYQINSASDAKKISDKIKKNSIEMTNGIEMARRVAYERKIATDELKITLEDKRSKMKALHKELEKITRNVEKATKKNSDLQIETIKIESAIDKIKEASSNLEPKYLENAQRELSDALVKTTLQSEKAQSELNAAEKIETITKKKLQEFENEYNRLETHTNDKIQETERTILNVANTIEHIMKTFDEMTTVSKDLLKTSVSARSGEIERSSYTLENSLSEREIEETVA